MIKRFIAYYKPHRLIFALDMLAAFLVAATGLFYPEITKEMQNVWVPEGNVRMIVVGALLLVGIYFVRMLLEFFIQCFGHIMGVRMQAQMRSDLFRHLERLPYSFFDNHETGNLMSRMTNDLFEITELAHHGPENVIITLLSVVFSFVYLLNIHTRLALITFACLPVLLIIAISLHHKMDRTFTKSRRSIAEINSSLENSLSGIRVTKAFGNAAVEQRKFERGNRHFVESRKEAYTFMAIFHSSTEFVTHIFNVVVLVAGAIFLANGSIELGDYMAFIVAINVFISPVMTFVNFIEQFEEGATGFRRFAEVMDTEVEEDNEGAVELTDVKGEIVYRNVTSTYDERKPVLRGINLNIKAGETLALVGASGGGKTTLCHLLPRFYPINGGEITIDGHNIENVTMASLRKNIGIVQQDVYLFNASIKENILYGNPDATDEEVIEAAKRANMHDFIVSLPEGYATQLGERGAKLSGGQKQRLSIARVFLKNPPLVILDEATSALDNTTEILVQEALDELCLGRTTIVVAHRLSTIKHANHIAVIENGLVVEEGTHDALLAKGGIYADLYNTQLKAEIG